jgi:transcriptional regulator with XRE-family HTH domain
MSPGNLIRQTRNRHGLSQRRLARRAGASQAWISRVERDEVSPSIESLERLLLVMGEKLCLDTDALSDDDEVDPDWRRAHRGRSMTECLERSFDAARFASELRGRGGSAMGDGSFSPERIFGALQRHSVDYVAIGGVAANAHGSRRVTLDVDIIFEPSDANYRRLAAALDELDALETAVDSDFRSLDPRESFDLARAKVLKLGTSSGDFDIVNGAPGAPPYEGLRARAVSVEVRGVRIPMTSLDDLIAMKRAAGRPQDIRDIAELTEGGADE